MVELVEWTVSEGFGGGLGGLAASDAGEGDVSSGRGSGASWALAGGLGNTPAPRLARQALLLLLEGNRRGIHPTEHLIHRLAVGDIVLRQPARPKVRAAT